MLELVTLLALVGGNENRKCESSVRELSYEDSGRGGTISELEKRLSSRVSVTCGNINNIDNIEISHNERESHSSCILRIRIDSGYWFEQSFTLLCIMMLSGKEFFRFKVNV